MDSNNSKILCHRNRLYFQHLCSLCYLPMRTLTSEIDPISTSEKIYRKLSKSSMHESNPVHARLLQILIGYLHLLQKRVMNSSISTTKITLKSGFIGIGTHKSIIDFLYYSYILNPVFVRLVIYRRDDK
jgi:hypothetical protein